MSVSRFSLTTSCDRYFNYKSWYSVKSVNEYTHHLMSPKPVCFVTRLRNGMQSHIRMTGIAHMSGHFSANQKHSELLSVCLSVCLWQTFHQTCRHFNAALAMAMYIFFVRLVVALAREATCLEGVCRGTRGGGGLECGSQGVTILLVLSVAYSPQHTTCRMMGFCTCVMRFNLKYCFSPLFHLKMYIVQNYKGQVFPVLN